VQGHAQAGLSRSLVDLVHDLSCHLSQRQGIVVRDHQSITAPGLGDHRALPHFLHRILQGRGRGHRRRPHQSPEPIDVRLLDTQQIDADGVIDGPRSRHGRP